MVRYPKITSKPRFHPTKLNSFMMSRIIRVFLTGCVVLPAALVAGMMHSTGAIAQSIEVEDESLQQPSDLPSGDDSFEDLRPLAREGTFLSIEGGQQLMRQAQSAVAAENYDVAVERLQESRQVFNQLSNFYQQLASSFSGVDPRINSGLRTQALEAAQMRDRATYQLALVHRAQNQPELAVPLLIQIINSQQPTRELGQQAYQQLFELGFVDSPYPRVEGEGATTINPTAP